MPKVMGTGLGHSATFPRQAPPQARPRHQGICASANTALETWGCRIPSAHHALTTVRGVHRALERRELSNNKKSNTPGPSRTRASPLYAQIDARAAPRRPVRARTTPLGYRFPLLWHLAPVDFWWAIRALGWHWSGIGDREVR